MEVLIALVIITCCLTLATVIYLNIQKSSLSFFKIKAMELAESSMQKTLEEHSFTEDTYKAEGFTIKRSVRLHELFGDCYVIRLLVFDGAKKKVAEFEATVKPNNR